MPNKCAQCGKKLVIGKGQPAKGAVWDHPVWVCPDHGENCVWRECEFADDPETATWTPNIDAFTLDREVRCCKAGVRDETDGLPFGVTPETCAACPIPDAMAAKRWRDACGVKLVEAVKESVKRCMEHNDFPCSECATYIVCKKQAALAAHSAADKEVVTERCKSCGGTGDFGLHMDTSCPSCRGTGIRKTAEAAHEAAEKAGL